eukprot:scaffold34106_cov22-Phaeocystis_antarctica.AAC.1
MKRAGAGVPFAPCASEPGSIAGPIRRVEAPVLPSGTSIPKRGGRAPSGFAPLHACPMVAKG